MDNIKNILDGATELTRSTSYTENRFQGLNINERNKNSYSIIVPALYYKGMTFEEGLLRYEAIGNKPVEYVIGVSIDNGLAKIPLRKGDILGRDGNGIKIRMDVFNTKPSKEKGFVLYSTINLEDAKAVLNSRAYVSGNGLNKNRVLSRNMATPGYEAIPGEYKINFTASKFDGKYRKLYKDNDVPVEGNLEDGFLKVDKKIIVMLKINGENVELKKDDIVKDNTSRHFYILRKRVTNLADNYNITSPLGNKVQVKLLYKDDAAPPAAPVQPGAPEQPLNQRRNANATAPLPAVAAQALGEKVANLNAANGGLPELLRNGLAIKPAKNAIARLNPKVAEAGEVAAGEAGEEGEAGEAPVQNQVAVNLNANARATALTTALNTSKKGGDQTILQKARARAVKSITEVVDLYFDNDVLKNGSNDNQLPTKAEYDTKMNLVSISTRAFVRVCEAIRGLSEKSTQQHMDNVFAELIPIVNYVDTENPTLDGLNALPIEPAAAVGGRRRRTKGKGKKSTKRRMPKAKGKRKTKAKTQAKATRKNRRS